MYLSEVELVGPDQPEPVEGEEDECDHQHGDDNLVQMSHLPHSSP